MCALSIEQSSCVSLFVELQAVESIQVMPSGPVLAYECLWRGCDYQYEDLQELKIHLLDSTCHLRKSGTPQLS